MLGQYLIVRSNFVITLLPKILYSIVQINLNTSELIIIINKYNNNKRQRTESHSYMETWLSNSQGKSEIL